MGFFRAKPDRKMAAFFPMVAAVASTAGSAAPAASGPPAPVLTAQASGSGWTIGFHDGEKFVGGFGGNREIYVDYWSLRAKSVELWHRNHYARGILGTILANKINTGLDLEAVPVESVIGVEQDSLDAWSERTEEQWDLWANDPELCDFYGKQTYGEIQYQEEIEAMVAGAVL